MTTIDFSKELNNILEFWSTQMVDLENGGFYGRMDGENHLHEHANKGVILNARILWTYSAAYQLTENEEHKILAKRAFDYVTNCFFDSEGGVFWMLDYKGNPTETKKQIYAQSFVIYGLTEYYKITASEEALNLSIQLFKLIEKHAFDDRYNGYLEALSRDWKPLQDVRLSDKDLNAVKTMNTHLHILEAYTNLCRVWKSEDLRKKLKNLIELMMEKFVDDGYHFKLFFDGNWTLLSHEFSYGHDIEGSWLLHEAAEVLDNKDVLKKVESLAIKMADAALEGMDEDGGLMNEGNDQTIIDTDKHWWPQAEALVGLVNAWQLTKNDKYLDQAEATWTFIQENLIDHENGEWHWKVSKYRVNGFKEDKAGPWKCPYHNGRAMLEVLNRIT